MAGRRAIENLKRLLLLFVERNRKVKNCYNVGGECSLRKKEREILSCVSLSLSYSPSFQFFPSPPLPFLPPGTRLISELSVGVIASARERYGFSSPLLPPPFQRIRQAAKKGGEGGRKSGLSVWSLPPGSLPPYFKTGHCASVSALFFYYWMGGEERGRSGRTET